MRRTPGRPEDVEMCPEGVSQVVGARYTTTRRQRTKRCVSREQQRGRATLEEASSSDGGQADGSHLRTIEELL